jgi:predicted nucleic acid-binding protein
VPGLGLVLDASAALAWLVDRVDAAEARLADDVLRNIQTCDAAVPALWFPEVTNGVLVAERRGGVGVDQSASFMGFITTLPIVEDRTRPSSVQGTVLTLARVYELTGYDATYLELVLRTGRTLATFDRKLAEAVRKAGGKVFGDPV